jgi:hypothetical protein
VDDVLVYKGNLKACPPKEAFSVKNRKTSRSSSSNAGGSGGGVSGMMSAEEEEFWWVQDMTGGQGGYMDLSQSILFTNDPMIISKEVCALCGTEVYSCACCAVLAVI